MAFLATAGGKNGCTGVATLEDLGYSNKEAQELIAALTMIGVLKAARPAESIWLKYGWQDAAFAHEWFRASHFADTGERAGVVRQAAVRDYIRQEGLPEIFAEVNGPKWHLQPELGPVDRTQLEKALIHRRSARFYSPAAVPLSSIGQLLLHATIELRSLRQDAAKYCADNPEVFLRSSFSAFELYVVAHRVDDLPSGLYHFDTRNGDLTLLKEGQFDRHVKHLLWGQHMAEGNAVTIFITARFGRYMWRYKHPRAYQQLFVNVGELAQLFLIVATCLELYGCVTPGFRDSATDSFLGLDPQVEETVYAITLGAGRKR